MAGRRTARSRRRSTPRRCRLSRCLPANICATNAWKRVSASLNSSRLICLACWPRWRASCVGEQKVNRTSPITSRSFAPQAEHVRTRDVWLIKQRQDLIAPATALLELSTMLLQDAQDRGEEEFLRDQQQICGSSQQLVTMIENVLDPRTL